MPRKAAARPKCTNCGRPAAPRLYKGKRKAWAKTCGRAKCLSARKAHVGEPRTYRQTVDCELCGDTIAKSGPSQRWCKRCVPSVRWRHRARRYGIGKVQWDALVEKQGGTCVLCDGKPSVVDHDHGHGGVRGILCHRCNSMLGALDESVEWRRRADRYRRKAKK